ncbi:MAG: alpha-amylase family glycosyl hydrolase [Nannocystaceae bacterium]
MAFPCALAVILAAACATGEPPYSESGGTTTTMSGTSTTTSTSSTSSTSEASTSTSTTTGTETEGETDTDTTTTGEEMIDFDSPKLRIYQLTVRLFSNTKTINISDGDIDTNGVGKFAEIDETALAELRAMGYSHIWLHGVLQQATTTDYPDIGEPPDDNDAVKGRAGSYYAIRDYYDVSPDYAVDPEARLDEFKELVQRIHAADMKVIIDLVPNHLARTYHSNIPTKLDFGIGDSTGVFFTPGNHFYYLVEPPGQQLMLPKPDWWTAPGELDGTIDDENNDGLPMGDLPRATGNNVATSAPAVTDWYDTVKLNYGYDFTTMMGTYDPMPKTWVDMDKVIAYWQTMGVDGFRADYAHYVPAEFWTWAIGQARSRDSEVYFVAEAYENDPNAVAGLTFQGLLDAGFDAIYDDTTYDAVKRVFCCSGQANDLSQIITDHEAISDSLLRYGENHDERRIASPVVMGGDPDASGFGSMEAGVPVTALLYLLGKGPIMLYNGQEVGEPGSGPEGYGREDGRTTIFDYWAMPEFAKWVNGHAYDGGQLGQNQKDLRATYRRLIALATSSAVATGDFVNLQEHNVAEDSNGTYCSAGRWCYSFIRSSVDDALLVSVNLNPNNMYTLDLRVPQEALDAIGLGDATEIILEDRMDPAATPITAEVAKLTAGGVKVTIAKSQARVFAMTPAR